jgi:circadian clock protein KaiC
MQSIGLNLKQWVEKGLLQILSARSSLYGLETHLVTMQRAVDNFKPSVVIVDPISNLINIGESADVRSMLTRLIDHLKSKQITTMFTNLTHIANLDRTESEVSSIMDTWILVRDIEIAGERNRAINVLKSRGMPHSNQIREFLLTSKGVDIVDVYTGLAGVLTGSARLTQEAKEENEKEARKEETERLQRELERRRKLLESQVAALQAEFEAKAEEIQKLIAEENRKEKTQMQNREEMSRLRKADDESLKGKNE